MADEPLTRDALYDRLRAAFPALHWGPSEEAGWLGGYLVHVEPDDDDDPDTLRDAEGDGPRPEITKAIAAAGWRIHRYDDESQLWFLAPADDEDAGLE
ncbi:MAG: hypothetical protein H0V44_11475 [Planctomycetes bacterium]|nr:hypothetical protein [Planctomycetota bacterium]